MKVLLAHDGSVTAARAARLITTINWPAEAVVHLVRAYERDDDDRLRVRAQDELNVARGALLAGHRSVTTALLHGRPATVILEEATRIRADVLVIGSHGRGAIASMLLGSVANEVSDHAACPVLVARADRIGRVVLAHDGSDGARQAEALLLQLPFLRERPVHVITAWSIAPGYGVYDPTGGAFSADLYSELVDAVRDDAKRAQGDVLARLRSANISATGQVRESPAADAITDSAGPSDLIIIGARGRRGLTRLLLGSVSRRVLHQAKASVLIVPPCAIT
jgi:nucleotide-binding universal stress UspA family protein